MAFDGLSQVHVSVDDIRESVRFYRDVLGLRLLLEVPEQSMAFFDLNGTRLYLGKPESPEFRSTPLLYFSVDDIAAEFTRLEELEVEFIDKPHKVHESDGYELWMAFFKTPDGHVNAITEDRQI
jgi:catechol 2,3-dioxygenase-like lactoylglutathione lyase family enzyme